jgi:demethylmenaquinone methyltransferase/2-methoxy-6-polyprenyl-1,4-benzoquinol methylase
MPDQRSGHLMVEYIFKELLGHDIRGQCIRENGILSMKRKYPSVVQVTDKHRVQMVKEIFSTITNKYDFLNHFLSLGQDINWRRFAAGKMRFFRTHRFLDVATGTSDLAIEAALRHPSIHVAGVDFVQQMIDIAWKKIKKIKLSDRIEIIKGDALQLPYRHDSFDTAGMAFGIRNITDRIKALKEMMRVVVPGGQVLILEMTFPEGRLFKRIFHIYLNILIPIMARAFSSNPNAYYYLGDSIMNFPKASDFALLMEKAGLVDIELYTLTLGITRLHIGYKPGMGRSPYEKNE